MNLVVLLLTASCAVAGAGDWPSYGHTPNRNSIAVDGPNTIDANTVAWIADEDPQDPNYYVELEGASGPVVYNEMVYAYAKYFEPNDSVPDTYDYTHSQVVAYDCNSGEIEWATVIDKAIWDSWSTPCIDTKHNTVLIGSGYKVFALDANSGTQLWATQLDSFIVNASVCAAVDISDARAFITDYDGSGTTGKLYCINLDANEPNNRYEPGQIVWADAIGGSSGNTPAYKDGVVYVSSMKGTTNTTGTIYAYDAEANTPTELWQSTDANFVGFFGGVTVTKQGYLYAASYNFFGGEDNSVLCKIDCSDGNVVWITDVERTESMPIVVGDKIYITGGLEGYGSRPKVEAYLDHGDRAGKLWETSAGMLVGGWTNQPAYANGKLYVGAIPTGGNFFGAYTDLYIFDVTITAADSNLIPDDPNFIIDNYDGCGNSPAVTCDSIYTIGQNGLYKFQQPALLGDISKNDRVDVNDMGEFIKVWLYDGPVGTVRSDLDLDGDIDSIDFSILAGQWDKQLN